MTVFNLGKVEKISHGYVLSYIVQFINKVEILQIDLDFCFLNFYYHHC